MVYDYIQVLGFELMKIFMLCNIELPVISEKIGNQVSVFGGWMDDVSRFLMQGNDVTICYMNDSNMSYTDNQNKYIGFIETQSNIVLSRVLNEDKYDLYHIWGTEYMHSLICISILEEKKLLDKCVVSIQGLVSVYANHFTEGLPSYLLKRRNIKEVIYGNSILNGIKSFRENGESEIKLIKKAKHFIGRTSWDKACLWNMNNNSVYHKCNENLRDCFYDIDNSWNIKNINPYTIFVSQCSYPIKGFHFLLEAMPLILDKYPQARIITTGEDFTNVRGIKKLSLDSYKAYLIGLIERYELSEKIEFKGYLSAEQMKEEYLSANVFVSPSTIENSPNSVGEAMILGCPVVSSYVGGIMDMLRHNEEGFLYQASSVEMLAFYVCQVFGDKKKTEQISLNARNRALITHDRVKNNTNLLKIYKELSGVK